MSLKWLNTFSFIISEIQKAGERKPYILLNQF